jgi:hypothetical protein
MPYETRKSTKEEEVFFVVVNGAAGAVWVDKRDPADVWQANINERGWTRQDIEGGYGSIYGEFETRQEAEALWEELVAQFDD